MAAAVRILPLWHTRYRGCDAYYFLLTAEIFRKEKKIPIRLPDHYLLDIAEQWYPPGFSVFLSLFPPAVLGKYHWLISPVLDLLNLVLLLVVTGITTHSSTALLISGLTYIFTMTLLLEGVNLNARFLGNLQVSVMMVLIWLFLDTHNYWFLAGILLSVVLILLTHKMSFQFLVVFAAVASAAWLTLWPAVFLGAAMALAFILTGGYYYKILRGHYDIVSFWNKYWQDLGAHQVYGSPAYQDRRPAGERKEIRLAQLGFISGLRFLLVNQSFIILIPAVFYLPAGINDPAIILLNKIWFTSGIVIFLLTTYINGLKLFGEGYKYLKFTAFPGAFLLGTAIYRLDGPGQKLLGTAWLAAVLALAALLIYKYRQGWFDQDHSLLNKDGQDLIQYLRGRPELDKILCIPTGICDALVYHARKQVLWGTHSYLFNEKVKDFYPVLRYPLEYFAQKYHLQCAVINKKYVDPKVLRLENPLAEFGEWAVYSVRDLRSI
jgi:hypothetical protein